MKKYEVCPAFGWGTVGPATSGIRQKLRHLGLENKATPVWAKVDKPVTPYPIEVCGPEEAVREFAQYMVASGYDSAERVEGLLQ